MAETGTDRANNNIEIIREQIRSLTVEQINKLYDCLYPLKGMFDDVNTDDVKALSEGKVLLKTMDMLLPLLTKAENISQEAIVNEPTVKALLETVSVADLLEMLKNEQKKFDPHNELSIDQLLPY